MDVAANAQRVGGGRAEVDREAGGGGRAEGESRLEVDRQAAGRGEKSRGSETGTYHSLMKKELEKTRKGGQNAKTKRECERAEDWKDIEKEHSPDSEADQFHHKPISPFTKEVPKNNQGGSPSQQAISYQEKAHTVGLVGTGRPSSSELSFCETANSVGTVGAADDSER